jgi:hypothetical protein
MIQRRTVRETSGRKGGKINMWNPLRINERQLHKLYPDLSPQDLLLQYMGKNASVNRDEFQRAQWFWGRRPNKLILSVDKSIRIGIFYILLLFTSMLVQNQTLAIDVVIHSVAWIALAAIAVAVLLIYSAMLSGSGIIAAQFPGFLQRLVSRKHRYNISSGPSMSFPSGFVA